MVVGELHAPANICNDGKETSERLPVPPNVLGVTISGPRSMPDEQRTFRLTSFSECLVPCDSAPTHVWWNLKSKAYSCPAMNESDVFIGLRGFSEIISVIVVDRSSL